MAGSRSRLVSTFSSSNLHAASQIHEYIVSQDRMQNIEVNLAKDVTKSSMIVPTLKKILLEHGERLARYTIGLVADVETLAVLERENVINWCLHARTLIPFNTDSDGNCLVHALSIYVWGVHDRNLTLRGFLYKKLQRANKTGELYRRWKYAQEESLREIQTSFPSIEVARDWETVVNIASLTEFPMGNRGQKYSPLEDIHIFTMSNILARPIIVLSERVHHGSNGTSLQPNQISGIYLPLLRDPYECERSPIVIGYITGHFVPLLSGEDMDMLISTRRVHPDAQHCVPLVYRDMTDIPIRFTVPGESSTSLLSKYTDCFLIPAMNGDIKPAVSLKFKSPPAWSVELMYSLYSKAQETFREYTAPGAAKYVGGTAKYVGGTATPDPPAFCEPVNSFREQTHFMQQSSNRAYSQAPLTTGYSWSGTNATVTFAGSNADRKPCIRVHSGCKNFGEERFNNFCFDCYISFCSRLPQSSGRIDKERSEPYDVLQRPPTTSATRVGIKIPEPPTDAFSREPVAKKCLISHCRKQGKGEFMEMCESCYRERMAKPTGVARSDVKPNQITAVTGKVFCADPGCQEEIVPGTDRCEDHLNNRPDCITENCGKKAVDNEIPLCSDCRMKNLEASEKQLRRNSTVTKQNKTEFLPPTTYQTFEKVKPSPATGVFHQYPQSAYDQPQWQLPMNRNKTPSSQQRPAKCENLHCNNCGTIEKDNLCNECYDLKVQFYSNEKERRRSEMSIGGYSHGQQFAGEGRRPLNSSVTPAVRSQIETKLRMAGYEDMSSNAYQSQTRSEDWKYPSQRTNDVRGSSDRQMQSELDRHEGQRSYKGDRIYVNERDMEALRRYDQPRNQENIYEEIEERQVDRQMFSGAQTVRRPSNEAMSSERPGDSPRIQGGFINEGYQPGIYSVLEERRQSRNKCAKPGCRNDRVGELNDLCETCHAESVRAKEQDRQARKLAYVNPIPCKTRGCPRFAEGSSKEYCESCLYRVGRNFHESPAVSSSSAVSTGYGGGIDAGRQEAMPITRRQPNLCATSFCDFYASGEYGPYCSKCFMEQTKLDAANSAGVGNPLTSSADSQRLQFLVRGSGAENMPCRREGCDLFGSLERNGYCSQCYDLYL